MGQRGLRWVPQEHHLEEASAVLPGPGIHTEHSPAWERTAWVSSVPVAYMWAYMCTSTLHSNRDSHKLACSPQLGLEGTGISSAVCHTCAAQWPYNVAGWTVQQRWETVFDKLEERGIDYGKICRIWPFFIRLPVNTVELYLKVNCDLNILIDELLKGTSCWSVSLLQLLRLQEPACRGGSCLHGKPS